MKARLLALAVLLVGAAIAFASPPSVAVVAIALPLFGVVTGPRFRVDRIGQAAITIAAMIAGVLVPRVLVGEEAALEDPAVLGERALLLAMPMLAVAAARAPLHSPVFGDRLTLTAALVALTGAGRSLSGFAYPLLAALAVAAGLAALYVRDPGRPAPKLLHPRHVLAIAFGGAAALGLTALAWWSLPRLHDAALARFAARWARARTGIADTMSLGDLTGMLQSDTIVMRVRGGAPPLLRATALTTYAAGRWEADTALPGVEVVETPTEPSAPEGLIEIEHARKPSRYFVPLGARDVVVSTGVFQRDALQLHRPSTKFEAKRVWFAVSGGPTPLAPRAADQQVPRSIRPALGEIVRKWGAAEGPPSARVAAIAARLEADYRYSLTFERKRGADPVIQFLTLDPQGHCEYFATAMALLARTAGVPARLITGYRVTEASPFGYHVVRERNAHSWVEVWQGDRWVTVDPTPAADLAAASSATTPLLGALADGVSTAWERVDDWLGKRSAFEMSLMLVGLVALLILARVLRGRVARARASVAVDPPLPGFSLLARALAGRGLARGVDETLSRFAARLEAQIEARGDREVGGEGIEVGSIEARSAELVRRYELLRYAGRGDAAAIDREMADLARAVSAGGG